MDCKICVNLQKIFTCLEVSKVSSSFTLHFSLHFSLRSHILFVATQMFLRPYQRGLRPLYFSLWSKTIPEGAPPPTLFPPVTYLVSATQMFLRPYRRGLRPLHFSLRSHISFVTTQMFLRPYWRGLHPLHFSLRSHILFVPT